MYYVYTHMYIHMRIAELDDGRAELREDDGVEENAVEDLDDVVFVCVLLSSLWLDCVCLYLIVRLLLVYDLV